MTIQQANVAAGLQFVPLGSGGEPQCQYYQPEKRLKGIGLMVTNGVISRVDITNPRIKTLSGIKVGNTEKQVRSVYGSKIQVKQHHYNSKGHYLIYVPQDDRDRRYQIVFETDGQRVVNWRFGKVEEVNWIEGCS
jgi:predicted small secreted protein